MSQCFHCAIPAHDCEPYLIATLTAEFVQSHDSDEIASCAQRAASKVRYARAIIRDQNTGDYHVYGVRDRNSVTSTTPLEKEEGK